MSCCKTHNCGDRDCAGCALVVELKEAEAAVVERNGVITRQERDLAAVTKKRDAARKTSATLLARLVKASDRAMRLDRVLDTIKDERQAVLHLLDAKHNERIEEAARRVVAELERVKTELAACRE